MSRQIGLEGFFVIVRVHRGTETVGSNIGSTVHHPGDQFLVDHGHDGHAQVRVTCLGGRRMVDQQGFRSGRQCLFDGIFVSIFAACFEVRDILGRHIGSHIDGFRLESHSELRGFGNGVDHDGVNRLLLAGEFHLIAGSPVVFILGQGHGDAGGPAVDLIRAGADRGGGHAVAGCFISVLIDDVDIAQRVFESADDRFC